MGTYDGQADAPCRRRPGTASQASVDAWGVLPTNQEDLIQIALRYIGPVAAAINAGDPHFMAYQGGIFDNPYCHQEPNHAVLITGYGEELDPATNTTLRYWIARNSWGPQWGEGGFIRIRRGSGKKKTPGVCGVARSASVALGGRLVGSSRWSYTSGDWNNTSWEGWDTDMNNFCDATTPQNSLVHVRCRRLMDFFNTHRVTALISLSLGAVLLLAWTLTYSCRRRAEAQKFRRRVLLDQQARQPQQRSRDEDTEGAFRVLDEFFVDVDENTPFLRVVDENNDLSSRPRCQPAMRDNMDVDGEPEDAYPSTGLSGVESSVGTAIDSKPNIPPMACEVLLDSHNNLGQNGNAGDSGDALVFDATTSEDESSYHRPTLPAPSSPLTEGTLSLSSIEESEHPPLNDIDDDEDFGDGDATNRALRRLLASDSTSPLLQKYGGLALYGTTTTTTGSGSESGGAVRPDSSFQSHSHFGPFQSS
jgi:Papain family cysteine protease